RGRPFWSSGYPIAQAWSRLRVRRTHQHRSDFLRLLSHQILPLRGFLGELRQPRDDTRIYPVSAIRNPRLPLSSRRWERFSEFLALLGFLTQLAWTRSSLVVVG